MSFFKIISLILLRVTYTKSELTNDVLNDIETQLEKSLDNKYFIIVNKDDNGQEIEKYDDVMDNNQKGKYYLILDKDLKPVERRLRDIKKHKEEMKQAELLKSQQARKVKEITEFMQTNYLTTNFLYDEVQRIKRERKVKDDLRKMIEYLGRSDKRHMKAKVLKCYYEARKNELITQDIWRHETNNLVINVQKDPYNYGFIN